MKLDSTASVLLTGANGGIGAAIAREIGRTGAKLLLSARRADAIAPLAKELGAQVIIADLANRADVARLADDAANVDVIVANAALPATGNVLDFSVEEMDRALDVNLRAPMTLARIGAERMVARGRGHLVFISSISGKIASRYSTIYSATKFGMRGFALGMREDLKGTGVGVTTIYPGFIRDAGMFANTGVELPKSVGTRSPEDVARAVLRAIDKNPSEITVAAFEQRFAGALGSVAPDAISAMQKLFGADKLADKLAEGHRARR
jgi:short-subunit dehydrogenase